MHVLIVKKVSDGCLLMCECGHYVAKIPTRVINYVAQGVMFEELFASVREAHKIHRSASGFSDLGARKPMMHPVVVEQINRASAWEPWSGWPT